MYTFGERFAWNEKECERETKRAKGEEELMKPTLTQQNN